MPESSAKFRPIRRPRSSSIVAGEILSQIEAGTLLPGMRLPAERDLALQFGVSRTILREALSGLQLLGIIRRVAGGGTYIQGYTEGALASQAMPLMGAGAPGMARLFEAREAIETGVVSLLLDQSALDLSVCRDCLGEMRAALEVDHKEAYLDLSLEFHVHLAAAAGNGILEELTASLVARMRDFEVLLRALYADSRAAWKSMGNHETLLKHIESRDTGASLIAVRQHYQDYPWVPSNHDSHRVSHGAPTK